MANLPYKIRDLIWIGDSREELSSFPPDVKRSFGFALRLVQNGQAPVIAKSLKGYGFGAYELRENGPGKTFRVVYLLKLEKGIYVIDAFVKKSKTGSKVPKEIRERIEQCIRLAREMDETS
jgi:phage-related protein